MFDLQPKFSLAREETQLLSKEGKKLLDRYQEVSKLSWLRDKKVVEPKSSLALQQVLNGFSYLPSLKEDGEIVSKTTSRFKQVLVEYGLGALLKRIS